MLGDVNGLPEAAQGCAPTSAGAAGRNGPASLWMRFSSTAMVRCTPSSVQALHHKHGTALKLQGHSTASKGLVSAYAQGKIPWIEFDSSCEQS